MGEWLGVPPDVWGAVVGALLGIVGAQLLDMRRERMDREARSREKVTDNVYLGVQGEIHKLLTGNRQWAESSWSFGSIITGPIQTGSLEDPYHHPLRDDLELLITRTREHGEAWSTMHERARAELMETLKDTRLKTHGDPSRPIADILGDTYFDIRLLSTLYDDDSAPWVEALVRELFSRHGQGWYSYKDPVKDNLGAELLPAFQRQKDNMNGEIAAYKKSIEALKEQARVIDAGLKEAGRQRAFYPGKPVARYKFWAKDRAADTS